MRPLSTSEGLEKGERDLPLGLSLSNGRARFAVCERPSVGPETDAHLGVTGSKSEMYFVGPPLAGAPFSRDTARPQAPALHGHQAKLAEATPSS